MAIIHSDIYKILREIIEKLSLIDQNLDHIILGRKARDAQALDILNEAIAELKAKQDVLKLQFFEFLRHLYQSGGGNIHDLDLFQLQDEVFREIGYKREDELVGLLEGLDGFKKTGNEVNEGIDQLMKDYHIEPRCSGSKESCKEVGQEKGEGLKVKESWVSSDVAVAMYGSPLHMAMHIQAMYGFPLDIAMRIEASLGHRKLIEDENLFDDDEAKIGLDEDSDEDGEWKGKDTGEVLNWVRANKLKKKFEELKKKLYKKKELDLNAEPKVSGDDNYVSLRITFLKVIRNWIFHMESVFFNLMYELYYMLSGNEAAETIFKDCKSGLKNMKETNDGMVPITVYKIIHMMENPIGFKLGGIGTEKLHEKMRLNDVMTLVHKIISSFRLVLATSGLYYKQGLKEDESALVEKLLKESEEDVREIERNINWTKSELKRKS